MRKELTAKEKALEEEKRYLKKLEDSTAYKVGRAVTWLPRKMKDAVNVSKKS